ncbi:uncharacterized protein FPRN_03771 [Fusarium proliferatum]|nr:uncharacterized protein FPRN_03771 [Fusarium proliferatum]
MAETAGLVLGVVGLASSFDTIIKYLEYAHVGKTFDTDFQDSVLKLDNARLQLSRWGAAVKLSYVDENTVSMDAVHMAESDIPKVKKRLDWILAAVRKCEEASKKIDKDGDFDPLPSLQPMARPLHIKISEVVKSRRNKLSKLELAKWAIYDKGHFQTLINSITEHTDALVKLFPANEDEEKRLCKVETASLCESLAILQKAIAKQDKKLDEALKPILKPLVASVQTNIEKSQIGVVTNQGGHVEQTFGNMSF